MKKELLTLRRKIQSNLIDSDLTSCIATMTIVNTFERQFLYDNQTLALEIRPYLTFIKDPTIIYHIVSFGKGRFRIHTPSGFSYVMPTNQTIIELAIFLERERIKSIYS